ncbi:MAG: metallophosphoesterase [Clostridia bacterium]|nr:metallophosphoesterase [Clostridia bacterium]
MLKLVMRDSLKLAKQKKMMVILAALLILVILNLYLSNTWVEVNIYNINPDKLPEEFNGYTIVQLSDIHFRNLRGLKKDFMGIAEEKAGKMGIRIDCVCITGDLIDNGRGIITRVADYVGEIAKKYPVYFVGGNHDYKPGISGFEKLLSDRGAVILENDAVKITRGKAHMWMVGISDHQYGMDRPDLAFRDVAIQDFSITMIHEPVTFKELAKNGADFVMSGHTHAGQIRLPFLPVLYSPGQGFFPEYGYGFYTTERPDNAKAVMYVSKGIGYTGDRIGVRFTNRPEIAMFILKKK